MIVRAPKMIAIKQQSAETLTSYIEKMNQLKHTKWFYEKKLYELFQIVTKSICEQLI